MASAEPPLASHVERNIATIARIEQAALEHRSAVDRLSTAIANFAGSLKFVVANLVVIGFWIAMNRRGAAHSFDPYPFQLLGGIIAIEALLIAAVVLMNQNQMTRSAERRAHLTLQVDLLAEAEMTKALELLQAISQHLGISQGSDEEVRELSQPTQVEHVARVINEALPDKAAHGQPPRKFEE